MLELYGYWRSSAAYRVRIALNLKGLDYRSVAVNLATGGQHDADFAARNPERLVPCLAVDDVTISQSLAICEFLEARYPQPRLLPADALQAAAVRSFCLAVACDIHPLNNLRVLRYLETDLQQEKLARDQWYRHWIAQGLPALESRLAACRSPFYCADSPGLAECFLIPQLYNARRFDCPLDAFPRLRDWEARCLALPAFAAAAPENQPDAPDHRE